MKYVDATQLKKHRLYLRYHVLNGTKSLTFFKYIHKYDDRLSDVMIFGQIWQWENGQAISREFVKRPYLISLDDNSIGTGFYSKMSVFEITFDEFINNVVVETL